MKNKSFFIIALLFATINVCAQNSSVEENLAKTAPDSTLMEKFINQCQFYSTECFFKTNKEQNCGSFYVEGIVYKDLITNEKIGGIMLWENEKKDTYLGVLDFDELDDFILALNSIIDNISMKHYGLEKTYSIYYRSRGGIDVTAYDNGSWKYFILHKKWYYLNDNGIWYWVEVSANKREIKNMGEIIQGLEKAKTVLAKELENAD